MSEAFDQKLDGIGAVSIPVGNGIALQSISLASAVPDDPEFKYQQYLFTSDGDNDGAAAGTGVDINSVPAWALGFSGKGVSIGVYDTAMDVHHVDLSRNVDMSETIAGANASRISAFGDEHATAVAGIIAGARNGIGIVGVAYDAHITPVNIFDENASSGYVWKAIDEQGRFDITNHSWAFTTMFDAHAYTRTGLKHLDGFADAAAHGRGGLGTIANVAAGNYREYGYSTEFNALTTDRHVVVVGATDFAGNVTSYSNPGASLFVVAPSSDENFGVTTSDVTGARGYSSGDYTDSFGGTSAATPEVSGVEALMLQANHHLGWRDVQMILAISARHTGSEIGDAPSGYETGAWTVNQASFWNGGGMHFSNDYGFGLVDARAAVALAETWSEMSGPWTSRNEQSAVGALRGPWNVGEGHTTDLTISINKHLSVEALKLNLAGLRFSDSSHLIIEITSPTGTVSHVLGGEANGASIKNGWQFMSRAFMGEDASGVWHVSITSSDDGDIGRLSKAVLTAYGSKSGHAGVFFYTDEFADRSDHASGTLTSPERAATINAAAVSEGTTVDLGALTALIAGRTLTIDPGTRVRSVITGTGDDTVIGGSQAIRVATGFGSDSVIGGDSADRIDGGRGSDTIEGGAGRDYLLGGAGYDVLSYEHALGAVHVSLGRTGWQSTGSAGTDRQSGFEALTGSAFDDRLTGDSRHNVLRGGEGNDVLVGGGGADALFGGAGIDSVRYSGARGAVVADLTRGIAYGKGQGHDTIDGIENVFGSRYNDKLTGDADDNTLAGTGGNDVLMGNGGADRLLGGLGSDTASYAASKTGVTADLGAHAGYGGDAEGDRYWSIENVTGSSFDDTLVGDRHGNRLLAAGGDDTVEGGGGDDHLDGGLGLDTVSYEHAHAGVVVDLAIHGAQNTRSAGHDVIRHFENILGSSHGDRLLGDNGDNVITGGLGHDVLTGRQGADTFHFRSADEGGDTIRDFSAAAGDRIGIDRSGFGIGDNVALGQGGDDDFANYWTSGPGATATATGHGQFVFDTTTHVLFWDADGAGGLDPVRIARFANGAELSASDFYLI